MMFRFLGLISLVFAASTATAHPGHLHESAATLQHGIAHPWTGFDHLLAAIVVGLIASQRRPRLSWTLPVLFCCSMAVSGFAGHAIGSVLQWEVGLAITLCALGACLILPVRPSVLLAIVLVCGGLHGIAHGAGSGVGEASAGSIAGVILGTAALHALGIASGIAFNQMRNPATWVKVSGTIACTAGVALLVGWV